MASPAAPQQRCVLYVFDGLMEDQADDVKVMPNLAAFRKRAARMRTHRPVFPTVTRCNAAAIATGCFPGTTGLHANMSMLHGLATDAPTEANFTTMGELHAATGEGLLTPSLGAMLAENWGLQYWGLGSWTNGCAAMHHPPNDAADGSTGAALHCEFEHRAANSGGPNL